MTANTSGNRRPVCGGTLLTPRSAVWRTASAEQRARIVQAAERLIGEHGADAVSVAGICAAAGVSQSAFHAAFEAPSQCLLAVFEEASAHVGAAMVVAYRAGGTWPDALRGALFELLAFLDDRPGLARFLLVDSLAGDAAMRTRRDELLEELAFALEADRPPVAAGSLPAPFGAQAVVGAVASILHGRLIEEPVPPLRELCGSLMSLIVLPYLDVDAARRELVRPAPGRSER